MPTAELIVAVGGNYFLVIGGEILWLSPGDAGGVKISGLILLYVVLTPITSDKNDNSLKNWHVDSCFPDAPDLLAFFFRLNTSWSSLLTFVHASVIKFSVKIKFLRVMR